MKRVYYIVATIVAAVIFVFMFAPTPLNMGASVPRKTGQISFLSAGDIHLLDIDSGVITRLTQGAGAIRVVWSPDGESLVFNRRDEAVSKSHYDLYLFRVSSGESKRLTSDGLGEVALWSPDGKSIAYSPRYGGALYVIDVTGGQQRKLADQASDASWSPDSKQIAFVANDASNPAATQFIAVVSADGTNMRRYGEGTGPVWSPDGKQIAYADNSGLNHLMLMNADGSNVRTLQTLKGNIRVGEWSPDGKFLSFGESRSDRFELPYVIGADGNNLVDLMQLLDEHPGDRSPLPSWSPDGKRLIFSASFDKICEYDANRPRLKALCWMNGYAPRWSPDGKLVVFLGKNDQICTASSPSDEKCYGENVKGKSNIQWRP